MRFLKKDLKPVYVYIPKKVDSGYVGTKKEYELCCVVACIISPVSSKLEAEAYGERVFKMKKLMCTKNEDIKEGYQISINGENKPKYKVVSVIEYTYHKEFVAELII